MAIDFVGTKSVLRRVVPAAVGHLARGLAAADLQVSVKSVMLASTPDLLEDILQGLRAEEVQMRPALVAPDLGIDQSLGRTRARPKARARTAAASVGHRRVRKFGLKRSSAIAVYKAGPWAKERYSARVTGVPPTTAARLRRQAAAHICAVPCFSTAELGQARALQILSSSCC